MVGQSLFFAVPHWNQLDCMWAYKNKITFFDCYKEQMSEWLFLSYFWVVVGVYLFNLFRIQGKPNVLSEYFLTVQVKNCFIAYFDLAFPATFY